MSAKWGLMPDDDMCLMPVGRNRLCILPGDHDGGCGEPDPLYPPEATAVEPVVRCATCDHGPSTHTRAIGMCWQTSCSCSRYVDPIAAAKRRHPSSLKEQK